MDIPYLVRRARLVLGQTQGQFAEQFEEGFSDLKVRFSNR